MANGLNITELSGIVERYPWFTTARRARVLQTGQSDPALVLPLMFWPTIAPSARPVSGSRTAVSAPDSSTTKTAGNRAGNADSIIEKFLQHGDYKIVPGGDEGDVAAAVNTPEDDLDAEFATEELAEIYRAQGLDDQAEKIYSKLKRP